MKILENVAKVNKTRISDKTKTVLVLSSQTEIPKSQVRCFIQLKLYDGNFYSYNKNLDFEINIFSSLVSLIYIKEWQLF